MKLSFVLFITICALTCLPTTVEGADRTFFIIRFRLRELISNIFFPERRNERDCDTLKASTGLTSTEECFCFGSDKFGVSVICDPMKEKICLLPSSELFCSNASDATEVTATSTAYFAGSTSRKLLGIFSPPIMVAQEAVVVYFESTDFLNGFLFVFDRGDGQSSSKMYSGCSITSNTLVNDTEFDFDECSSCDICDSGVDFKYDCSNANGTFAFSDVTNTTELVPGPKVDSCIPIADVLPSF